MKIHSSWKRKCVCGHMKSNHMISWSGKMLNCLYCDCGHWRIAPKRKSK